ncbi:SDR family NAD(P)-dependent oxidoreductase [Rhodovibrionaceae bacterium A322]
MRLAGKVALVTGATSGIGRRTVERFLEEGAQVAFTGRRAAVGADVAAATGATFIEADAGREEDAERAIKETHDRFGRLDILMNNAGAPAPGGRIETLPMDGFDKAIAVHVRGVLAHMKHATPLMKAQGSGSIINVGSVAAHRAGYTSSIIYALAKAAVVHLTRCAAMELGEDRVRVNSISPGGIATGIFGKAMGLDPEKADQTAEKVEAALAGFQALPQAGLTQDIANAALYLASDESGFVNGEDIVVDGGLIWGRRYSEANAGGHAWKSLFD